VWAMDWYWRRWRAMCSRASCYRRKRRSFTRLVVVLKNI